MEYYFLAHTGRMATQERTQAIKSTNSFITFTEYDKTMSIKIHTLIVKALKKIGIKNINDFIAKPVNSINTSEFEKTLIKTIIIQLENEHNLVKNLREKIKSTGKLSLREYYILNDYNTKSTIDINIDKYNIYMLLDVFIMEYIHHLFKKKKGNLYGFIQKYKIQDINISEDNCVYNDIYNWDTILKNINPENKFNKEIMSKLKMKYDKIYSHFTNDSFYNIFKKITNIDIKIYKTGMTLPNLNFEFNGIFTFSTRSDIYKMGLYNFNEIYSEIITSKQSGIIPKNIDVDANEDEILKTIADEKKYILNKSIFPQETNCEIVKVGRRNKIMFCPTTMKELLNYTETNIKDGIFYLFGCSVQPIKKNPSDEIMKMMQLSRQISIENQADFEKMKDKINSDIKNISPADMTTIAPLLDDENPLLDEENDDMRNKYLKYKMKYLHLKKLL